MGISELRMERKEKGVQEEIENGEKGSQSWGLPGVVGVRGERERKEEAKKRKWKGRGRVGKVTD